MSLIQVQHLTFAYPGTYDAIFEDAGFQFDTAWRLGFTGRNGRGKTTFLRLLLGEYEYRGTISAGVRFDYFPFHVTDPAQMTLEILCGVCPAAEEWEVLRETSLLEVEVEALYRPFATLSPGEQTKALLAALFLREGRFLLIDEPTNHLDAAARQAVGRYLRQKSGFLLVSHDRALLDSCVDHILSINKANIEVQSGNFSSWWANKQLEDRFELEQNARLKKEIKRLEVTAREKAGWSDRVEATKIGNHVADRGHIGHLAAKTMARSKAIEKRNESKIEEKSALLKNIEQSGNIKLVPLRFHSDLLLELRDVTVFYGDAPACAPLSLQLRQGERLALTGKNGCGKSSILKLLCGEALTYTGEFWRQPQLVISHVSQDTSQLRGSLREYAESCGVDESLFKALLRQLDFARVQFEKDMAAFSEGQKKKVLLARSLAERAHLYVWDEPLNYVDVLSRLQIEALIREHRPTMLFVEHDAAFRKGAATREIVMP
ncbi:MAG: ABC-F type ribosomal protection protein [Oscillospiraceae bacterium]|jgi:lincosamide and streptogramin A transport system ATP-binding/permease protein|nr:ABC-F type ribosomal protection protein [Oscillospiraceae bacterium]